MSNKIKINPHRVKEALGYRGKSMTWLATRLRQANGRMGADKATLQNYLRDGFAEESAASVAKALRVRLDWLCEFLRVDDTV